MFPAAPGVGHDSPHRFFSQTDGTGHPGALSTDSASRRAHSMLGEVVGSQEQGTIKEVNHHVTPREISGQPQPTVLVSGSIWWQATGESRTRYSRTPSPLVQDCASPVGL